MSNVYDTFTDDETQLEDLWELVARDGEILFAGIEKDARQYVEQHFPRIHVQPGSRKKKKIQEPGAVDTQTADVSLHSPAGSVEQYEGPESGYKVLIPASASAPVSVPVSTGEGEGEGS